MGQPECDTCLLDSCQQLRAGSGPVFLEAGGYATFGVPYIMLRVLELPGEVEQIDEAY